MPKLSIIVPVYNVQEYLKQCIDSILAQTFTDFELILINDGSTDSSKEICKEYSLKDERIVFVEQENQGLCGAIVTGVKKAGGKYIGFVDSDDWIMENMFNALMSAMHKHQVDLVQCGVLIDGTHTKSELTSDKQILVQNLQNDIVKNFFEKDASIYPITNSRWNKVYKKEIINTYIETLDRYVSMGEDLIFNLKYLERCKTVLVLKNENNYCYRTNNQSMSKKYNEKKRDSYLYMFTQLYKCAQEMDYKSDAVVTLQENTICSMMLDTLLSSLSQDSKIDNLNYLYKKLRNKEHIKVYSQERPFIAKIALFLIHRKMFKTVVFITGLKR